MISSQTSSKLAEIIRDTWPQQYWLKDFKKVNKNDDKHNTTTNKGVV
jgi:hypothetical protein